MTILLYNYYFRSYLGATSMDKNPFIGSISCDDRHRSANKVRNADHVTTRSEVKALFFLINLQFLKQQKYFTD